MIELDKAIKEWSGEHQVFELDYHSKDNYRWHDDQFCPAWRQNFGEFLGLAPDAFQADDHLLDLGCGSRPALSYFTRGEIWNLDPLLTEYRNIPQVKKYWEELGPLNTIAFAAEHTVHELRGKFAFVNCWNCLDHSYDWRGVLNNMIEYTKRGGIIALCTDTKGHGKGHPGIDDPAEMLQTITTWCKIEKLEINYGKTVVRDIALKARRL